jgi:two-component system response regulator AdeR
LTGPPRTERPVVIVADDDQGIRALFRATLEREGFTVLLAWDGYQAIGLARSSRAAVMLLDLHMPGLDGLAVLRRLRADPNLGKLPVILITGSTAEADRVSALDSGANGVVVKPVSVTELVAHVRAVTAPEEARP